MTKETTFFSYSRSDSDFVLKLAKNLRDAGADLWLDQLDIVAGSHWDNSVEAALNSASKLIVILSSASVASNNVMDEVSFALGKNKTIIPVVISECSIPFRLKRLQHIDLTGDYNSGLNNLLVALGNKKGVIIPDNKTVKKSNTRKYIFIGAGIIVAGFGIWAIMNLG